MTDTTEISLVIQGCSAFISLLPSEVQLLASASCRLSFKRGDLVFEPGDASDSLFILTEGRVLLSHRERGKRAIIESIWPNELFGHCALIHSGPREASCEVPRKASAIQIPITLIQQIMRTNPRFAQDLMERVGAAMRRLAYRLVSNLLRPTRQRLFDELTHLATTRGTPTDSGVLLPGEFTHQELAEMSGATRETVTHTLRELKREEAISFDRRRIIIPAKNTAND